MANSTDQGPLNTISIDPAKPATDRIDPTTRIRIDDKEYDFAKLSEEARNLIIQMRVTDQEITRHRAMVAILHEARQSCGTRLKALLPTT